MRKQLLLLTLATLGWWITINLSWVSVGDKAFTGGNLSPVLNLMPGIILLMIFISAYGKLRRSLLTGIALIASYAGYVSYFTDWIASSAITTEFERLTGVAGGDHSAVNVASDVSGAAIVASLLAVLVAVLATFFALKNPSRVQKLAIKEDRNEQPDNRALWDEQEN